MKKRATLHLEQDFVKKWRAFASPMKSQIKSELKKGHSARVAVNSVFRARKVREKLRTLVLDMVAKAINL